MKRISYARGKGKLRHNNREMISPNVDKARIKDNIELKRQSLADAYEVRFGDGLARYEHAADAHHDHLICENCGRNIEVVDSQIEELQDALARKHGFKPTFHRLYLYGICPDCQRNR